MLNEILTPVEVIWAGVTLEGGLFDDRVDVFQHQGPVGLSVGEQVQSHNTYVYRFTLSPEQILYLSAKQSNHWRCLCASVTQL